MLIKPKVMPADPTKVCKTCGHYDPTLQICCARDMLITKADAEQWTCGDWEENLNVFTATETIGIDPVNPVEVPLQPDGSLKIKHSETIGMTILNPEGITSATLHTRHCGNCKHQRGDAICAGAHEPVNYECKDWEPDGSLNVQASETIGAETVNKDAVVRLQTLCDEAEPCKAKVTFQYKESGEERWDHQLEVKALDRGAKQGMTLEALETVFAIACQQVPSMEKRWMELKAEINIMFAQKWAAEDMPE